MIRYRAYLWAAPLLLISVLLVAMAFVSGPIQAKSGGFYRQTNLVSDIRGMARVTDSNLVNPWGLSHSPTSPWWVSDNHTGVATVYKGDGTPFRWAPRSWSLSRRQEEVSQGQPQPRQAM